MTATVLRWPTRRDAIAGGLAAIGAGIAAASCGSAFAGEAEILKRLAAEKGLIYGTTISAKQIVHDPAFIGLVERQAGLVVPENDMKWQDINRGAPGDDDYQRADTVAGFAVESGMALRGHNCLWYFRTPSWFFTLSGRAAQERAIADHITTLVGRYRGIVHSWDVVNEPIEPGDGRLDGLRKAVFLDALGPGYLDLAYRLARESDPKARLVVNEYDIELDTPAQDTRRVILLDLLQRMQTAGTPVDAVGIQAHLTAVGGPPFSAAKLRRFLADIAALGLTIQITELDVTDAKAPADFVVRDQLVADTYRRFLDAALDEPAVKMVVTWGLSDRHSWIVRHETNQSKWRKDGLPSRPLPFDAELQPTPAFAAIAAAFSHAPARTPG
ncbi:MAG TPA: endo-1,4-beta-xylanase [Stellaceae bacterium]|nr:endo-1,4-beta-xylanase [Stellaceae bacterium]